MQSITANRLADGRVVFRAPDGAWTTNLARAARFDDAAAVEAALAASKQDAERCIVLDPYAIEIEAGADGVVPKALKEKIRAAGPTTGSEIAPDRHAPDRYADA